MMLNSMKDFGKLIDVITLVNDWHKYESNVIATLQNQGVYLIPIPNPDSATSGLNEGLEIASNEIVVMCHQDVKFPENWVLQLKEQIEIIKDDNFGVLGTYGISYDQKDGVGCVRSGEKELRRGLLPCLASYLDEHCLIIRKGSGLVLDTSLPYYHMYGADLCMQAYQKKMNCYAIDNHLHHLSDNQGNDPNLDLAIQWFQNKWAGNSRFSTYRITAAGKRFLL